MGIKQELNGTFDKYSVNLYKAGSTDYEVKARIIGEIGYIKEVLASERRKKYVIDGKVYGGFWKLQDKLVEANKSVNEVRSYIAESGYIPDKEDVAVLKDIKNALKNNDYLQRIKGRKGIKTTLRDLNSHIDNYVATYSKIKVDNFGSAAKYAHKTNLEHKSETVVTNKKDNKRGLEGTINKITTFATVAIVTASLIGGCIGYYARDKSAKDEIAKLKNQKQIVSIVKDKQTSEQAKVESMIITAKQTLEDKLVEAKAESKKTEDKEIWGNGGYNKKDRKWTQIKDVPEYTPEKLAKREKYREIYSKFRNKSKEQFKSVTNWLGHSLWGAAKLPVDACGTVYTTATIPFREHGFKDTWQSLKNVSGDAWDVGEGVNKAASGVTLGTLNGVAGSTPLGILDKGVDAVDWTIWNTYDALPFGDYDGKIKYELIRIDRWGEKDGFLCTTFNKEHPENVIKTPISLASDYFLGKWIFGWIKDKWLGGGKDGSAPWSRAGRSGGAGGGIPGRSGGAGGP